MEMALSTNATLLHVAHSALAAISVFETATKTVVNKILTTTNPFDLAIIVDSRNSLPQQPQDSNQAVDTRNTIPQTALVGATRLRVAMRYGGTAYACGTFTWGEVEDYAATITE